MEKQRVELSRVVASNPVESPCDRVTGQYAVHHEHCGDPAPTSASGRFTYRTIQQEQPYRKRVKVDTTPQQVRMGWAEDWELGVGLVVIDFNRPRSLINLTKEKQEALDRQRLCIGFAEDTCHLKLPQGVPFIAEVFPKDLWLSTNEGILEVFVTLLPK